jgi:hypothetical protein
VSTGERKRSLSRSKADSEKRSSIGKDNVVVGAGELGVLHHKRNSVSERPRNTTPPNWPLTADAGGVGPAGEAPRQVEQVSTPFEHPREAPMPPWPGVEQPADAAGEHHQYNTIPSGIHTQSGVQHAKAAPSANAGTVTNEPGHYKTLASGTASGIAVASAAQPKRQDVASHERGDYNVLASSGAPKTSTTMRDARASEAGNHHVRKSSGSPSSARQDDAEDAAEYNVLPSGTPSGVKVKPRSAPAHDHDQLSRGQHNPRLPEAPPSLPPVDITSHADTLRDLPVPNTKSSSNPTYPHAEMAQQHMSPEVMPDSYRASAPGHTSHHAAQPTRQPQLRGGDADEHNHNSNNGKSFRDRVQDTRNARTGNGGQNAALAAATSSWATGSTMGTSNSPSHSAVGGVPDMARVMHPCEHCGRENDITRYFSGQNVNGSGGGLERSGSGLWQGRRG